MLSRFTRLLAVPERCCASPGSIEPTCPSWSPQRCRRASGPGCGFVSLGETWCDTTTDVGRLVMTIMGGIAEFERSLIQMRLEEGIARAREKGKKFSRPSALDVGQRRKIAERYTAGETMAELAREYEVGEATIWRALQGPFEVAAVA